MWKPNENGSMLIHVLLEDDGPTFDVVPHGKFSGGFY